jgi:alpha-1,2-mannosyltransferase
MERAKSRISAPTRSPDLLTVLLWVTAAMVTAVLIGYRWHGTFSGPGGYDFRIFLIAAREIAAGHSPYSGGNPTFPYVYAPLLALALVPVSHLSGTLDWKGWTVVQFIALLVSAGTFVVSQAPRLSALLRPLVFAGCVVTGLTLWPLTYGLHIGQADLLVLLALMLSTLAATRSWPATRGALLGVAGLLKVWPALTAISLLQRSLADRRRSLWSFGATLALAPLLAVAFGGASGLAAFAKVVFDQSSQHLVSNSVWGIPDMLFSHSGFARPLLVSPALRMAGTIVLVAWVLGLLVKTLRTVDDPVLCTWNTTACVVLLLPVSHMAYSVLLLPLLWVWGTRVVVTRPQEPRTVAVVAVLVLWWLVQTHAWPGDGSSSTLSSIQFCMVFAANLAACTASVLSAGRGSPTRRDRDEFALADRPAEAGST